MRRQCDEPDCGKPHCSRGLCATHYSRLRRSGGITDKRRVPHGFSKTSEFSIWDHMRRRCYAPKESGYDIYGARGIRVCERWRNSFVNFYADMGPRPTKKHSIERRDNDGDYCPENCYWATWREQSRNKRSNHNITINGITHCIKDWAEISGVHFATIINRWRRNQGWGIEEAIFTPPLDRNRVRWSAKLTEEQVVEIRAKHKSGKATYIQLAAEYGVNKTTIWRNLTGKQWKHVPGAEGKQGSRN